MTHATTQAEPCVLGIETSGTTGGAAVIAGGRLAASLAFSSPTLYSQRLLPGIEWLLERAGIHVAAVNGIAVSRGPGSFTGLRIGMSVAKAMAFANSAPLVGVSTLEALALRAAGIAPGMPVCALLDARQGEVYAGLFRAVPPAAGVPGACIPMPAVERLQPDYAGKLEGIRGWVTGPTVFLGEGTLRYRAELAAAFGANFFLAPQIRLLPSAEEVAWLGHARLANGEQDDPVLLEPDYLRKGYMQRMKAEERT
jgi:tRNA threonylcarbamoyladenosine biosynthesis protein TsaB